MPEEFEGDLAGAEFWGADLTGARFRDVNLTDVTISHAWLVDGEWSFAQTLRHLVMAMDKWFTAPVLGEPFRSIEMPNTGSIDFPFPSVDRDAAPTRDLAKLEAG